jgi:hypothetical protein
VIVARALTEATVDDTTVGVNLIGATAGGAGQTLATGHSTFVCTKRENGWRVTALRFASAAPK